MSIVDSLRKLSLKLTGAYSSGEDIEDNIEYIAENYSGGGGSGEPSGVLKATIVESLPDNGVEDKLYLVLSDSEEHIYNEYIWSNDVWVDLGPIHVEIDVEEITDLKEDLNTVLPVAVRYPTFIRGYGNNTTGVFSPSESTLNRIIEMEFIPTALYDEVFHSEGLTCIFCYYDASYAFVSGTPSWDSNNPMVLDKTKPYVRVFCKKVDNTNFDTVPVDAISFVNKSKRALPESSFYTFNNAILGGTVYSGTVFTASLGPTVRWLLPEPLDVGFLKEINAKKIGATGTVTIELWTKSVNTYNRISIHTFNVDSGESSILSLNTKLTGKTYVTIAASTYHILKGDNASTGDFMYIIRDKTSSSFAESALEKFSNYKACIDIVWYGLPDNQTHIYRVGENDNVAEIITEAMNYNGSIVYIEPYEHDCIAEWEECFGTGYFANMASGRGLELCNDVHIIGLSGHKLKCYYTGNNDYVMANFSLFNNKSGGSGYTLENVCIDTKKIRYCVHDERNSDETPYRVRYSRCIMSQDMTGSTWDHSRACIGGGLGSYGDVLVEDCIFNTVTSEQNMDSLAYHNGSGNKCDNSVVIKNCYCTGDSTLQLASYGSSTKKTKVIVANCSFGSPIEEVDWTGGTPNFDIYYINNEIRSN